MSRRHTTEAKNDLHGVGGCSALLVVAEIGEPSRFHNVATAVPYFNAPCRHSSGALKAARTSVRFPPLPGLARGEVSR